MKVAYFALLKPHNNELFHNNIVMIIKSGVSKFYQLMKEGEKMKKLNKTTYCMEQSLEAFSHYCSCSASCSTCQCNCTIILTSTPQGNRSIDVHMGSYSSVQARNASNISAIVGMSCDPF